MEHIDEAKQNMRLRNLPTKGQEKTKLESKEKTSLVDSQSPPERSANIDIIMIYLTYGIYLFHLCILYIPSIELYIPYHKMSDASMSADNTFTVISLSYISPALSGFIDAWNPFSGISPDDILGLFIGFMHAWNIPMFFYLAGRNAYSALFKRSMTQFRKERIHRLIVPTLSLALVTQLPFHLSYLAPRDAPPEESFWEYAKYFYKLPACIHHAWFLFYLFIYSQVFTHLFIALHPAHPNTWSDWFVSKVNWFLGGPIRLALFPGMLIGVLETGHNLFPYDQMINEKIAWMLKSFPFFPYMSIFLLGYATAAADQHIRQDSMLWSWTCFTSGAVLCILYGPMSVFLTGTVKAVSLGFTRGIGLWLFCNGCIALAREKCVAQDWHNEYRKMAMPFYMIHHQVIIAVGACALWIPFLRTLPVMLVLTSFLSIALSKFIIKSGSLCYFFGVRPYTGSSLPGKKFGGFGPVLVLSCLFIPFQLLLAYDVL